MSGQFFAEEAMNAAYLKDGYVTVPLCDAGMLKHLQQLYYRFDPDIKAPFYCSNWKSHSDERMAENIGIRSVLTPVLSRIMPGYEMLYGAFITKRFHFNEKIHPHIDWQFVEEPKQVAFNVWMPFVNTGKMNGGLWIVPGSHCWTNEKRGPNIEISIPAEMLKDKKDIPLRAGEAIIYDTRLIHGSYPNRWPSRRIALANIMVPSGKNIVHHYKDPKSDEIVSFKVDADFYVAHCNFQRSSEKWNISDLLSTGRYVHM